VEVSRVLHIDFETRAALDLRKVGTWIYASHPTTDVHCAALAFDDETPVITNRRDNGNELPLRFEEHIRGGGIIVAHNAQFERTIFKQIMGPRYGWPVPEITQFRCTAAMAAAQSLPRSLEQCAEVCFATVRKDKEGAKVMRRLMKPLRSFAPDVARNMVVGGSTQAEQWTQGPDGALYFWETENSLFEKLYGYCVQDVVVEQRLWKLLRKLPAEELAVYHLDMLMNERGVCVDTGLVAKMSRIVRDTLSALNAEVEQITGGRVSRPSEVVKIKKHLKEVAGLELESLDKQAVAELLARDDLDDTVLRILSIRSEAAKASTAKLEALTNRTSPDGRMRHNLLYHGASTGRFVGQGAQLQNLPRGTKIMSIDKSLKKLALADIEAGMDAGTLDALYGAPLFLVSENLRACLTADPGKELIYADFNAIEARVLAWLAGQMDVLEKFATGQCVYRAMAGKIYDLSVEDALALGGASPERQMGKTVVLGAGFGLGWKKFQSSLETQSGLVIEAKEAAKIIRVYRAANDKIVAFWAALDEAAMNAVAFPGKSFSAGRITFRVAHGFLWMRLPSGRFLSYAQPSIASRTIEYETEDGELKRMTKDCVHFWAVDLKTRQWTQTSGYHGTWAENCTQAVARDLMVAAMLRVEAAGYPVILTIHDEIISEIPEGFGDIAAYEALMAEVPAWAEGCPVKAEGKRTKRYGK
jgi:DNA polymerase